MLVKADEDQRKFEEKELEVKAIEVKKKADVKETTLHTNTADRISRYALIALIIICLTVIIISLKGR